MASCCFYPDQTLSLLDFAPSNAPFHLQTYTHSTNSKQSSGFQHYAIQNLSHRQRGHLPSEINVGKNNNVQPARNVVFARSNRVNGTTHGAITCGKGGEPQGERLPTKVTRMSIQREVISRHVREWPLDETHLNTVFSPLQSLAPMTAVAPNRAIGSIRCCCPRA
jgi:hypothetical protein